MKTSPIGKRTGKVDYCRIVLASSFITVRSSIEEDNGDVLLCTCGYDIEMPPGEK